MSELELANHRASLKERLEDDHTYHAPKPGQTEQYEKIRAAALSFGKLIVDLTPPSRELSSALTRLEETVFHANAAIARKGD